MLIIIVSIMISLIIVISIIMYGLEIWVRQRLSTTSLGVLIPSQEPASDEVREILVKSLVVCWAGDVS